MITALPLLLFIFSVKQSNAQKFFIGYGLSLYTDMAVFAPEPIEGQSMDASYNFSVISLSAEMKYNIYEFNSDLAFSVASSPSFGIMISSSNSDYYSNMGYGNLRIPIYAQLDYGNLSTFESMKNFGVGIGIGYQYDIYNLFGDAESISLGTVGTRLGIRYFNRNNKSREIAVKVGLPKTVKTKTFSEMYINGDYIKMEQEIDTKITSIQLSWILYFNY